MLGAGINIFCLADWLICTAIVQIIVIFKNTANIQAIHITNNAANALCVSASGYFTIIEIISNISVTPGLYSTRFAANNAANKIFAGNIRRHIAVGNCYAGGVRRCTTAVIACAQNTAHIIAGSDNLACKSIVRNFEETHGLALISYDTANRIIAVNCGSTPAIIDCTANAAGKAANTI